MGSYHHRLKFKQMSKIVLPKELKCKKKYIHHYILALSVDLLLENPHTNVVKNIIWVSLWWLKYILCPSWVADG